MRQLILLFCLLALLIPACVITLIVALTSHKRCQRTRARSREYDGYDIGQGSEKKVNPYLPDDLKEEFRISWPDMSSPWIIENWPSTFDWDEPIKKDIVDRALTLPYGYCVIDCGAHIGDGSIPIAHALQTQGRSDIIVYAIEPSAQKCEFIEEQKAINKLNNLRVINIGLSDKEQNYQSGKPPPPDNVNGITVSNSGAIQWEESEGGERQTIFSTLDSMYERGMIREPLGYLHLDVEGMDMSAIRGGANVISHYMPILSLESLDDEPDDFLNTLPPGYTLREKIKNNFVLSNT
jgi:FkbM family methyltransferase